MNFRLKSDYKPTGDQPEAIDKLVKSISGGNNFQTLLGVTGSGKTFSMANVIQNSQRPSLIISHNKTWRLNYILNSKHFSRKCGRVFVSYYDYYQPKHMFQQPIHLLRKILLLMKK